VVKKPLVEVQKLLVRFDTGIQGTNVQNYYEIEWVLGERFRVNVMAVYSGIFRNTWQRSKLSTFIDKNRIFCRR